LLIFVDAAPPLSGGWNWALYVFILIVFVSSSECERCIALLEASVSVLLHCLEMVDTDSVARKGYFSWELEEGVKCACFLRRIYEEVCDVCMNIHYH
jgi:hypothetical protein